MSKTKFNMLHKMSQIWTVKDCILSHTLGRYKRGKGYLSEGQRGIIKEQERDEGTGAKDIFRKGGYDQSTLHECMKMSLSPLVCSNNYKRKNWFPNQPVCRIHYIALSTNYVDNMFPI